MWAGTTWQVGWVYSSVSVLLFCFPARPCFVGEWSPWSGCAGQCQPTTRVRRRSVRQEPLNGGAPCPPLEERAGCLEYSSSQSQDCGHSFGTGVLMAAVFVAFDDFLPLPERSYGAQGKFHELQGVGWTSLPNVDRQVRKCLLKL